MHVTLRLRFGIEIKANIILITIPMLVEDGKMQTDEFDRKWRKNIES